MLNELNKSMRSRHEIIPSILTDSAHVFSQELTFARDIVGAVHLDLIDSTFCSGRTLLPDQWPADAFAQYTEVHAMVNDPIQYLDAFASRKVTRLIVHVEAPFDLHELASQARIHDVLLGFAVNPDTDLDSIKRFVDISNYIQVMGVQPGRSNQVMLDHTALAVKYLAKNQLSHLTLSVDGGVTAATAAKLIQAGAKYLVSHKGVYEGSDWQGNYDTLESALK